MKNLLLVGMALFIVSCSPKESGDKKAELQKYRELVKEYTGKIETLEKELSVLEDSSALETPATSIEIKRIVPEPFASFFEAKGSLEALEDAFISPEMSGQIKSISIERGDQVKKGDLLIKLKTDITENSIREVKTSLELAKKIYEKQEELWSKNIGSEIQFLEAKNGKESLEARLATLESQLDLASIRAPFDGIIDDIMVKSGELASPGMRMLRLVNIEKMRITAQVSESFLSKVKRGDEVMLSFPSYPEISMKEKIERLGTVIDPITRTFAIEVLLNNNNEKLKPNMLSSILIQDYSDENALLVPSIILKQDFKGTFLFLVKEKENKSFAKKVYVKPGKTVQDVTKIEQGLHPEDQVIIKGYNLVADGEQVSVMN